MPKRKKSAKVWRTICRLVFTYSCEQAAELNLEQDADDVKDERRSAKKQRAASERDACSSLAANLIRQWKRVRFGDARAACTADAQIRCAEG